MQFTKHYNETLRETLYTAEHESGLSVAVLPKEGYSKSYAVFGTHFGSVDNRFIPPDGNEEIILPDGIAHFLEHKMFEQPDGSNVFESYARHGANANAYTSFHVTAYLFESTQDIAENLGILLDFVQKPYFTDENVDKEQGIIGQEIGMYDDDPGWQLMMSFLGAMFSQHPVRVDIAGTVESIAKINKETGEAKRKILLAELKEHDEIYHSMPRSDAMDSTFKRLQYTRYADDCAPRRRVQVA